MHNTRHWGERARERAREGVREREREDADILKSVAGSQSIGVKDPGNVQVSSLNHISIFTHDAHL